MTLDEAIKHCEKVAEQNKEAAVMYKQKKEASRFLEKDLAEEAELECLQCAEDHKMLANWLQELKEAKKFIRKVQNELMKGTSFYSTSFLEENGELMDELTKGVEYLDD